MRKFELLKDFATPFGEIKKGTISEVEGEYHVFPYIGKTKDEHWGWMGNGFLVLEPDEYPEWFREIVEREPFVWTDELVTEYRIWIYKAAIAQFLTEEQRMKTFKQMKQSPTTTIKAGDGYVGRTEEIKLGGGSGGASTYDEEKKEAVKSWLTFMPDGIDPREGKQPLNSEWEIVAYKSSLGNICKLRENGKFCYDNQGSTGIWSLAVVQKYSTIHSVKRLSDGEVFSVGDKVSTHYKGGDGFSDTIHHFTSCNGIIDVYFKDMAHTAYPISKWLKNAIKYPPSQPQNNIEKKTFEAGREMNNSGDTYDERGRPVHKYKTFEEYKKSNP